MAKKTGGISIPVRWDKRSLSNLMKDLEKVSMTLSGMSGNIDKSVKKTAKFSKEMSTAISGLEEFGDEAGKKLASEMKSVEAVLAKASSKVSKYEAKKRTGTLSAAEKRDYQKQRKIADAMISKQKVLIKENDKTIKQTRIRGRIRKEEIQDLKKMAGKTITGKRNVFFAAGGGFKGGAIKGSAGAGAIAGGLGNIGKIIGNQVMGKAAGGVLKMMGSAGGGGLGGILGKLLPMIGQIPKFFSAALGPILAIVQLVRDASDQFAKFNKVILSGIGTVNDLGASSEGFSNALDSVRKAAYDNNKAMLTMGLSTEEQLHIVNAYTKTATGSLVQTNDTFQKMIGGQAKFVNSVYLYGKALDMEATELASTFGTLQTEAGYSASNAMSAIESTVKAATHSGMPLGKFKMILQSVLPDVDAFTNRLEDLTGVVKMLGKSMSPDTIKKFLSAFTNMFSGSDFRKRLKATLIVGPGKMGKIITQGIDKNIKAEFGEGSDIYKAFQGKDKSKFNQVLMQNAASMKLNPKQIEELMSKFSAKQLVEKGGALNIASALASGTDPMQNMQIMREQVKAITGKDDLSGLNEHVAEMLGFSQEQVQALRRFDNSMQFLDDSVKTSGMTAYKSVNDALVKIAKQRQAEDPELAAKPITDVIKGLSAEDRQSAYKSSDELKKLGETSEDRQKLITSHTTSIDEKISNVIGMLLEKIFNLMSGILNSINGIFGFMLDSGSKELELAKKQLSGGSTPEQIARNAERAATIGNVISGSGDIAKKSADIAGLFALGSGSATQAFTDFDVDEAFARAKASGVNVAAIAGNAGGASGSMFGDDVEKHKVKEVIGAILGGDPEQVRQAIEEAAGDEAGLKALMGVLGPQLAQIALPSKGISATTSQTEAEARKAADLISAEEAALMSMPEGPAKQAAIEAFQSGRSSTVAASAAAPGAAAGTSAPAVAAAQAQSTTASASQQTADAAATTQTATTAMARDIADGLKLDSSFMSGIFKSTMIESVKKGVEEPLVQHAALLSKVMSDPAYATALAGGLGTQMGGFANVNMDATALASKITNLPQYADGGYVPKTTLALIHGGETVVPADGAAVAGGGKGVFAPNITVNVSGSGNGQEIARMIQEKIYEVYAGSVTA